MFRQRLFLVTAGLLATGVAVRAQPLTLEAAIQEALAHNRSLRTARSATVEAEARIKEARASFYPRINVVESWQRGNLPVFVFSSLLASRKFAAANFAIDALNHPNPQGFFQTSVGIDQLLFDGGRARSLLRAESLRRDVTMSATDEAAAGLVLAVTQTYGRVLVAQAARRAAEAGGEAAREDLTRVRARRDAGMATEADVLSLAVHVSDLDQRRIQAEGDAAVARAELNRLMGSAIDRDYRLEVPAQAVDPGSVPDLRTLLTEAEARRPELQRAAQAEALSEAMRRHARSALVPQAAAQAAFDVSGTSFSDRASSWVVGGQLRWSFSTGGAELARMKASTEALSRARLEREDARAAVEVELLSALRRLESARARRVVSRSAVEQAGESHRIVRDRFEAGLATVTDVLRASTAQQDAEAQHTGALVDVLVGQAQLQKAVGRAAPPPIEPRPTN